jgi:hypothetical protein
MMVFSNKLFTSFKILVDKNVFYLILAFLGKAIMAENKNIRVNKGFLAR